MIYDNNRGPKIDPELFKNPTSDYRGTPFWAWNFKLDKEILIEQIEIFKEMGLGGFHMHPRVGMGTTYLGDEFMDCVKTCVDKAKEENMIAWLYDEDKWPSGYGGGYVTKDYNLRQRWLSITTQKLENIENKISFVTCYDIVFDSKDCLKEYNIIDEKDVASAKGTVYYVYLNIAQDTPYYNNQAYVDTLNPEAMKKFVEVTHERYKEVIGYAFGDNVPAIFTDEPQFSRKSVLKYAREDSEVVLPWTYTFAETYKEAYGIDIMEKLPELIWELPDGQISRARYCYHDHVAERFASAFADTIGKWCDENGIMLTGHMMEEPWLHSQTAALGDAMRSYRSFQLPGIDMLCDAREFTTAKQAQSAVHQYGTPGMLSELYGVTGWMFDFRGHKLAGDWQAALGVTVRVQHLAWASMAGEAKRDYPASISYQSPWYKEYPIVEDHFARVNVAMTRGKPVVKVGVIHPVESYWLHWGSEEQTAAIREQKDKDFQDFCHWLLLGQIDFDYISESLLPEQCDINNTVVMGEDGEIKFKVGEMEYDVLIVPNCETLRSSTVERLKTFNVHTNRLIFAGEAPKYVDAMTSDEAKKLYDESICVPFDRIAIMNALEDYREIEIKDEWGKRCNNLLHQMRQDGDDRWVFICQAFGKKENDYSRLSNYKIILEGRWTPKVYNTMTGEVEEIKFTHKAGKTILAKVMDIHDSLLLYLEAVEHGKSAKAVPGYVENITNPIIDNYWTNENTQYFLRKVPIELSEDNVLLLDYAEYALNDGEYLGEDEVLRAEDQLRKLTGFPNKGEFAQPWVIEDAPIKDYAHMRYTFESEINVDNIKLALEDAEIVKIVFNGETVLSKVDGYYIDHAIKTVSMPSVKKGTNVLELTIPYGPRSNVEACYLLGDFGVRVEGHKGVIISPIRELNFGDYAKQGLPFYGGNVTYKIKVNFENDEGKGRTLRVSDYKGAMLGITVDGERIGSIVYAPYEIALPDMEDGEHEIGIILLGSRQNTCGHIHDVNFLENWIGPNVFRLNGDTFTYEYVLSRMGVLKSPEMY